MSFPETIVLTPGQEKVISSGTRGIPLGTRAVIGDRVFRRSRAAAIAIGAGLLCQESVIISGHGGDLAVASAVAVGARTVTLTNSTTAITADQYAGGYLWVNDVDGEGHNYKIKSHPAESTGSGSIVITLEDDDTIRVALTTNSQVGLRVNPYNNLVVNPTSATGVPMGVTPVAVTASYYFWAQTWGLASVLGNGTLIVGKTVTPGASTAGSVDVHPLNSVDASGQEPVVGTVSRVLASTDYSLVMLTIAP